MSRKGDCHDNACSEHFFHTTKVETIHGERSSTREATREAAFEYIETDDNRIRHQTTIGNPSLVNHETAGAA